MRGWRIGPSFRTRRWRANIGVSGYYVRTVPLDCLTRNAARSEIVQIKNLARDPNLPANAQIATDFLQLVRYGLRLPDDPSVTATVKVVDGLLKTDDAERSGLAPL